MYCNLKALFLSLSIAALATVILPAVLWDAPYESPKAPEIAVALDADTTEFTVRQSPHRRTYAAPVGSIDPTWSRYVVGLEDVSLKSTRVDLKTSLSRSDVEQALPQRGWSRVTELDQRIYTRDGLRVTVDGSVNDESVHVSRASPPWLAPAGALLGVTLGLCAFFWKRRKFSRVKPTTATTVGAFLVTPTLIWQLCTALYEALSVGNAWRGLHYYAYPFEAFLVSAAWKMGALILVVEALRVASRARTQDLVST